VASVTAVNTSLLTTYLEKTFIPALENELQYQKFCTKGFIPEGMGNILRFNVFSSPAANVDPLDEGSATDHIITTLTTTGTDLTMAEYGEYIKVSRLQDYTQVPGARAELSDRMAYGGALSIDSLVLAASVTANTLDWYALATAVGGSAATGGGNPTAGSAACLIGAGAILHGSAVRGHKGVAGHPDGHFAAIVTPTFERDMVQEATTGRMTWAQAVTNVGGTMGQEKWVNGYMGSVYGIAAYRTQNFNQATVTINCDVSTLIGAGGLGCASLKDADPKIFVNTPSSGDTGNPYRNHSTVAWHAEFATKLIDVNRVVRIYTLA
jgi:hypothetical protein